MEIDAQAPAVARGEVRIAAPIDTVWSVIADLEGWPSWNPDVRSMSVEGSVEPGTVFRWRSGAAKLVSTLREVDRPHEIGWTGTTMGIHAVHVFRLTPFDEGTLVRSDESFRGLIPSVLKGYSRKLLQRGIETILARLKAEAEARQG